jgi:transcriptional regulator with XRE-family HTH domain
MASALVRVYSNAMLKLHPTVGQQLRTWRQQRGISQLDLALAAEVSARHLSFVETGRAQPGRELLLRLMAELQVPLRERNLALSVAGFAPVFQMRGYQDPSFDSIRAIINAALEQQKPFPAYVIDRHWNVVASNGALPELLEGVSATLLHPPVNIVRIVLHPDGYGERLLNRSIWRARLLSQMRRQLRLFSDPTLEALLEEALAYPQQERGNAVAEDFGPAVPMQLQTRLGRLSFLSATMIFGSPADITLEEIAVEMLHPADVVTDAAVREARRAVRTSA